MVPRSLQKEADRRAADKEPTTLNLRKSQVSKAALEVKFEREKNKIILQKKKAAALEGDIASVMDEVDEVTDVKHQKDVEEWLESEKGSKANVPTGLLGICGRKGEPYSLDMAELGADVTRDDGAGC